MNGMKIEKAIKILVPYKKSVFGDASEKYGGSISVEEIIELLKEQEAVEPIYIENPYTRLPVSYCSKCRERINKYITGNPCKKTEYCHYCGQAVKWE